MLVVNLGSGNSTLSGSGWITASTSRSPSLSLPSSEGMLSPIPQAEDPAERMVVTPSASDRPQRTSTSSASMPGIVSALKPARRARLEMLNRLEDYLQEATERKNLATAWMKTEERKVNKFVDLQFCCTLRLTIDMKLTLF